MNIEVEDLERQKERGCGSLEFCIDSIHDGLGACRSLGGCGAHGFAS